MLRTFPATTIRWNRVRRLVAIVLPLAAFAQPVYAQWSGPIACGPLTNAFGPFDYRTSDASRKYLVEHAHFTQEVENLKAGTSGPIAHDIDYTLRVFPNNPRALLAMSRLSKKTHSERPNGALFQVECYFDRAIRLTPDDPMPHLIYAMYLNDRQRKGDMKNQLDQVEGLRKDPSSFDLDYNLGLLYFEAGELDKSAVAAKRAYDLGAPLPALQNKLKKAGKWVE